MADGSDREEWMRRLGPLYPGAVAIRQTTAMRWPGDLRATADDSARAAPWMVVVGAVLGVAAWGVGWLAGLTGVAPAVAGTIAIVALVGLSAGLLDVGLARTVERWLARGEPREIGEEPRPALGAAGVSALLAAMVVRVVAIVSIRPSAWLAALVLAPLVGRWAALALQRLGQVIDPPEPDRRSLVVGSGSWAGLGVVTGLVALIAVLGVGVAGLLLLLVTGAVAVVVGVVVERTRGGLDAATLAATAAVCEVIVLVGVAAIVPAVGSAWVG